MKKMMLMASAMIVAATASARPVETASFDEVHINVPARVRIVEGERYGINVTAQNELLAKAIRYTVQDGVLKINTRDLESLGEAVNTLRITIVTPKELKVSTGRDVQTFTKNVQAEEATMGLAMAD